MTVTACEHEHEMMSLSFECVVIVLSKNPCQLRSPFEFELEKTGSQTRSLVTKASQFTSRNTRARHAHKLETAGSSLLLKTRATITSTAKYTTNVVSASSQRKLDTGVLRASDSAGSSDTSKKPVHA